LHITYLMLIKHIFQCLSPTATYSLKQRFVYLKNKDKRFIFTEIFISYKCIWIYFLSNLEIVHLVLKNLYQKTWIFFWWRGLPDKILKNFKYQECEGNSNLLAYSGLQGKRQKLFYSQNTLSEQIFTLKFAGLNECLYLISMCSQVLWDDNWQNSHGISSVEGMQMGGSPKFDIMLKSLVQS
jgi:hypothetical protein